MEMAEKICIASFNCPIAKGVNGDSKSIENLVEWTSPLVSLLATR
jgi:hypothetical protein